MIEEYEPQIDEKDDNNVSDSDEILPFNVEIESSELAVKKENLSRKGCIKNTPYEISSCLKRMNELLESNEKLSKRSVAAEVAKEFSTAWRNCYRWK